MSSIISAFGLKNISLENLIILDARAGKDAHQNYLKRHLKGARFIHLDEDLAEIGEDTSFGGRHPLPDVEKFAGILSSLGISNDSNIVVYDDKSGASAAARAWWMLKAFGLKMSKFWTEEFRLLRKNDCVFFRKRRI